MPTGITRKQIVLFAAGGIVLLLILAALGVLPGTGKTFRPEKVELTFWGYRDPEHVWTEVFELLKEVYPHIEVKYTQLSATNYEGVLINSIAAGKGPDVFMLSNEHIIKHANKIYPLPQQSVQFNADSFRNLFPDGPAEDLILPNGSILGLPLYIDSLALFYNKDLFNTAGIANPPTGSWDDVTALTRRLTKTTSFNDIVQSGLAFGTYKNVDRAFETISALMLQYGDPIVSRKTFIPSLKRQAIDALSFYTSFIDTTKANFSWTRRMPSALDAFAEGRAAMVTGLARDIETIRRKNPHLNFGVVPLPQLADSSVTVTYSDYDFPTVSRLSQNRGAAWQFIFFLISPDAARLYSEATGLPPARRDLLGAGGNSTINDVFYRQALIAKNWAIPDSQPTRGIFRGAIEGISAGTSNINEAIGSIQEQLRLLLPKLK